MTEGKPNNDDPRKQTVLFAQLIEILTQNAIMMLGAVPDRQGRQRPPDLNSAEMMIDMLSILHKKTKGNLTPDEEKMISGTLFQLQTAFAEVASKTGDFGKARKATEAMEEDASDLEEEESATPPHSQQPSSAPSQGKPQGIQSSAPQTDESKVKFAKKYN
jgi:hypothetical protein